MNERIKIVHLGNIATGQGGISSVIRGHLARESDFLEVTSAATHDPDRTGILARVTIWRGAFVHLLRLDSATIVHVHMSQRSSLLREGALLLLARARSHPVLVTLHGSGLFVVGRFERAVLTSILKRASVVHGFADSYRTHFQIASDRWTQIPNDVEVPLEIETERAKVVLFAGEVGFRKGIDILMEAWDSISTEPYELHVVGPITDFAQRYVSGPQPRVKFFGARAHKEVLKMMSKAAILVQPSRAEAFPMSVCEGIANGCAVVGTDVGGLGHLLRSSGQIVAAGSAGPLALSLRALMNDQQLQEELRRKGHAYASKELVSTRVTTAWELAYQSALARSVGGKR
ncbi:MAG: glycosyltransferase family 4 protein [Rhodoglobus sp.]